jgi:hypothetical protein
MFKAHQSHKIYPCDLTDEQWTLVEPLLPPPSHASEEGARARSICGKSSTRFGLSIGVGVNGLCCSTLSSPRVRPMTTLPDGGTTAPGARWLRCYANKRA